jgi:hypothetical protein
MVRDQGQCRERENRRENQLPPLTHNMTVLGICAASN